LTAALSIYYSHFVRTKDHGRAAIRVLSNPVAYRVLASIGMRGPQTTTELASSLDDVPPSSLYRQLARLRNAGVLRVAGERQARGAIERTYALASQDSGALAPADLAALPLARVRAAIRNFLATMLVDASAFIESRAFARNRTALKAALLVSKLTDEEYARVVRDFVATIKTAQERSASDPGAKRRYFYLVALPELGAR
jgi:DNA-binding transcriptional ArsR family regulator